MKKATRYFLPRADFGKGPIAFGIEINLERFLIRSDIHLGFHNFQDVGIYRASQPPSSRLPESLSSRAPLRMTRDRALWRGELLRVRGCQERRRAPPSVSGARPSLPACPPPYNRPLSTAFAAIQ